LRTNQNIGGKMEELNLETKNGRLPINKNIVEKYNLRKGTLSSFTCNRIVDKNGKYIIEKPKVKGLEEANEGDQAKENGLLLQTSEIIDFAQGADSQ
jgi:hypothetical protein